MSKAFTNEDAEVPDAPALRLGVPVPDGVPNCLTAAGAARLRAELTSLSTTPHTDARDARVRDLTDHLAVAVVVDTPLDPDRVGFGATVTVEAASGARTSYRIVGALEAAPRAGAISWQSPLALALFDAQVGDTVVLPRGEAAVVAIDYGS